MNRLITLWLCLASLVYAGRQPEVTEKEEKEVIAASHTVFEAIFVEEKISYVYNGKEVKKEEAFKNLKTPGFEDAPLEPMIRRGITLLVTDSIKGNLKKHQILTLTIDDFIGSMCPHYLNYGNYHTKQIYYNSGESKDHDYRYRTVREPVHFSTLANTTTILGNLGERIGKEMIIEGVQPKVEKNDPFGSPDDYFQVSKIGKKKADAQLTLKLDPEYAEAEGKLPEHGREVILEGYESIEITPFSTFDKHGLGGIGIEELEKKHPRLYNEYVLKTVFIVTDVSYK